MNLSYNHCMGLSRSKISEYLPLIVAAVYLVFSIAWVLVTDFLVYRSALLDTAILTRFQNYKGLFFIFLSTFLIYAFLQLTVRELLRSRRKIRDALEETIHTMVRVVESRDSYTAGHSERVARYAYLIGREIGLPEGELERLETAGFLHDIGKVETPDTILLKPGRLSHSEVRIIRSHPARGEMILRNMSIYPDLPLIVRHHHEWYNGKGYPDGLAGDAIPFHSRILTIADSYDAMTSRRVYRASMNHTEAIEEIRRFSGIQFDPAIVDAAIRALSSETLYLQDHLRSLKLEVERMAYYFKNKKTNFYNIEFVRFLSENMDFLLGLRMWKLEMVTFPEDTDDMTDLRSVFNTDSECMIIQVTGSLFCFVAVNEEDAPDFNLQNEDYIIEEVEPIEFVESIIHLYGSDSELEGVFPGELENTI